MDTDSMVDTQLLKDGTMNKKLSWGKGSTMCWVQTYNRKETMAVIEPLPGDPASRSRLMGSIDCLILRLNQNKRVHSPPPPN